MKAAGKKEEEEIAITDPEELQKAAAVASTLTPALLCMPHESAGTHASG